MWFVGSSRSNSSGSRRSALARATRICQPPESSEQGRPKSLFAKLKPVKTRSARCSISYPPKPSNSAAAAWYASCILAASSPVAAARAVSASASLLPAAVASISETASSYTVLVDPLMAS
mmetsp:Transcript_50156/g.116464  ORF Transcript_50156/g.116464 Transcript_50156/m.116464 type:complete len:120 (-) Transcript_50156:40-399(-)